MSRELKRVPMNFDWPMNEIWGGYLNPYARYIVECEACEATGLNPATKRLKDTFYDFKETGEKWNDKITQEEVDYLQSKDRLRTWKDGKWQNIPRKAEEVNKGQNSYPFFGVHDGINRWYLIEFRAKKQGVWGNCEECKGTCKSWPVRIINGKDVKALYDNWEPQEPPHGNGYQLWENTTEGSPMSPVFSTLDELCMWAEKNATTFATFKASWQKWKEMLTDGSVYHEKNNMVFM